MLSLIPWLEKRLEFAAIPCIAFSFWTLLVMVQISLQEAVIKSLVLGVTLVCCLLLLGFVSVRFWKAIGTPGVLILATMATYLVIGVAVLLVTDAESLQGKDVLRQVFFFLVTLAAMLGGRSLLERIGVEALLKWALVVLTASCAVILASPLLRDLGVLPEYRLARHTGAFSDPNDASFVACMTVALALAFQSNGRQHLLGSLALVLGYSAAFTTFSHTAVIILGVILTLFLLLNVRRLRQDLFRSGLIVPGLAGVLVYLVINLQLIGPFQQLAGRSSPVAPIVNISEGVIAEADEAKRVGDTIGASLVHDHDHREDDNPMSRWQWQRANAQSGDANTPDDATWVDIDPDGDLTSEYTLTADDQGKFFRAYVDYEKEGILYRGQTLAVGPILPAPAALPAALPTALPAATPTATTEAAEAASTLARELEQTRENIEVIRGETIERSDLLQRIGLWKIGSAKALASPLVGHGLYQLHYMEGAPLGYHGRPAGVHNLYLMLIGEAGIIPLALYLLWLFFLLRLRWRMPISLVRDSIFGWAVVMVLFNVAFQHMLAMGASNFLVGLSCALAAFLIQGRVESGERNGSHFSFLTSSLRQLV